MALFNAKKKETRYILSIDGGGMRGIIPAIVLSRLSSMLRSLGDRRPLYSHFDLIAGTSTGALIALCLSSPVEKTALEAEDILPYPVVKTYRNWFRKQETCIGTISPGADAAKLKDIYIENGTRIFPSASGVKAVLYPFFQDKYPAEPFEAILRKYLKDIGIDEALVPTMAVSFSIDTGRSYIIRSWDSHGLLAWESARASAAAPLYFPPAEITERDTGRKHRLIDGGVIANNPSLLAYAEARKLYPDADEYRILSLSTCSPVYTAEGKDISGGLTTWGSPAYHFITESEYEHVDIAAASIKDLSYTRIWEPVLQKKIKLDAVSKEHMQSLVEAGEKTAAASCSKLESFAEALAGEDVHSSVRLKSPAPYLCHDRS